MNSQDWRYQWRLRRVANELQAAQGRVVITFQGKRMQVVAPLHPDFVTGANELLGRWRSASKMWSFSIKSQRLVVELCERVYGRGCVVLEKAHRHRVIL